MVNGLSSAQLYSYLMPQVFFGFIKKHFTNMINIKDMRWGEQSIS